MSASASDLLRRGYEIGGDPVDAMTQAWSEANGATNAASRRLCDPSYMSAILTLKNLSRYGGTFWAFWRHDPDSARRAWKGQVR